MAALPRLALLGLLALSQTIPSLAQKPPDNDGPVKLVAASRLGGSGTDTLVGAQVLPDNTIVLAGNSEVWPAASVAPASIGTAAGTGGSFLLHLDSDGQKALGETRFAGVTLDRMKAGPDGALFLLGHAAAPVTLAGKTGTGPFVARLVPSLREVSSCLFDHDARDFGVDGNGDVVVLSGNTLVRYDPSGTKKWEANGKPYGGDRSGAMALSPQTGTAVVLGYGMTGTGHEPYKDPYAFAFDRAGRPLWTLWNPDPHREAGSQYGGNGLMADTTGRAAATAADGRLLLMLFADGGNTVCGRDPADPDKPLAPSVREGVYQADPGYGFQGAGKTSVLFRVDAATGKPDKETWMCAWKGWPQRDHANSLRMEDAAGDAQGNVFIVGDSASACPTLLPWYTAAEGAYKGGGFLAVFDRNLGMRQCGAFLGVDFSAVCCRGRRIVAVGTAGSDPVPQYRPLQSQPGGGEADGYFAIFQMGASLP